MSNNYLSLGLTFSFFICALFAPVTSLCQINTEILFESSDPVIQLAGTITKPEGEISSLAVLLPVAGPTDRDLTLGVHKYYKTLADSLAIAGTATLRYDDRGVGGSDGKFVNGSLMDRVGDACKALEQLSEEYPEVAKKGFIGMSEGAGISVLASQKCTSASFIVLLSMPVRKGVVEMQGQMTRLLAASPYPDSIKQKVSAEGKRFLELVSDSLPENNKEAILELLKGPFGPVILPPYQFVPQSPEAKTGFVLSNWYQSQLKYDISGALKMLKVPALTIYGDLDKAIDYEANIELMSSLSPELSIETISGLNHLMQEANTGWAMEYAMLPTSFSAKVIDRIVEWLEGI